MANSMTSTMAGSSTSAMAGKTTSSPANPAAPATTIPTGYTLADSIITVRPLAPPRILFRQRKSAVPTTPTGPFVMKNALGEATHSISGEDIAAWKHSPKHPNAISRIPEEVQRAIQRVLQNQAAFSNFAQYCTATLIKHYRLWVNLQVYRKKEFKASYEEIVQTAGKLLLREVQCTSSRARPSEEERNELIATERQAMMLLFRRSEELRCAVIKLNLATNIEADKYVDPLWMMVIWEPGRVQSLVEGGRKTLAKWIEMGWMEDPCPLLQAAVLRMKACRKRLVEIIEEHEERLKAHNALYLACITNRVPVRENRPPVVEFERRGENIAPLRP